MANVWQKNKRARLLMPTRHSGQNNVKGRSADEKCDTIWQNNMTVRLLTATKAQEAK